MDNRTFSLRSAALCLCLLLATPVLAESAKDTAERYAAEATHSLVTLSPSGNLIAYQKKTDDGAMVLVYSLKEGETLTGARVDDMDLMNLTFISDEQLIMRAGKERRISGFRGTDHHVKTAFALDVESGEIEQLLRPGDVLYRGQTQLGRIVGVSPDRKTLYMPGLVPRSKGDRSPDLALLEVDIDSPRNPKVLEEGHGFTVDWFVNSKGEVVAQERIDHERWRHSILVPDGRDWREIYVDEKKQDFADVSGMTADESSLVMLDQDPGTGLITYYTLNLKTEKKQKLELGSHDVDIEHIKTDANRVAVGVEFGGFNPSYHFFDETLNQRIGAIQKQFPDNSLYLIDMDRKREKLILYMTGQSTAGSYFLSTPEKPLSRLMEKHPHLGEEHRHPIVKFRFKARDGMVIPTLLTIPRDQAADPKNLPAVVMPHGGPEAHDKQRFDALVQAMAARGYAVIQPQFRGSDGFGYDHWAAGLGEWGRAMQDDVSDSVKGLAQMGVIDSGRTCIVGASYGGYAALAGAAFTPDLYQCAISIHGVSDLNKILENREDTLGDDHWVVDYFSRSIARDYFTPKRLAAHSPANFAASMKPPMLLVHGEEDPIVPIEQSELMRDKLEEAGKDVTFLPLEDTGHSWGQDEVRVTLFETVLSFLDEHLAPTQ